MGLVLEWVYGSIVSTAEKSRDGAKRQLGLRPPTAQQAYENLILALQDQATWEQRAKNAKALLNDILRSRKEADELSKKYDIKPVPGLGGSTAAASEAAGQDGDSDAVSIPDEVCRVVCNEFCVRCCWSNSWAGDIRKRSMPVWRQPAISHY